MSGYRDNSRQRLQDEFDVLVIGGGVNGLGIAWDAAERGLSVLVIDKGDWGSGTSSWSSRMIHGGLKYLEKLEVGLVRESLRDREWLLRRAPHLVAPLPFLLPFYKSNAHHWLKLRAGMVLYDILSFDKSLPHHRAYRRKRTEALLPGLSRDGLQGSALYYDAQVTYAERLCVEILLAARNAG
ncbi:MAG: FAD-dependent oxidoreductase, partial [Pseudonocardiaceae bacterium]